MIGMWPLLSCSAKLLLDALHFFKVCRHREVS